MIDKNLYYTWFNDFISTLQWILKEYNISFLDLSRSANLNYSLMCKKLNKKGFLTISDYLQIKNALISLSVPKNTVSLLDKSSTIVLKTLNLL